MILIHVMTILAILILCLGQRLGKRLRWSSQRATSWWSWRRGLIRVDDELKGRGGDNRNQHKEVIYWQRHREWWNYRYHCWKCICFGWFQGKLVTSRAFKANQDKHPSLESKQKTRNQDDHRLQFAWRAVPVLRLGKLRDPAYPMWLLQ